MAEETTLCFILGRIILIKSSARHTPRRVDTRRSSSNFYQTIEVAQRGLRT